MRLEIFYCPFQGGTSFVDHLEESQHDSYIIDCGMKLSLKPINQTYLLNRKSGQTDGNMQTYMSRINLC